MKRRPVVKSSTPQYPSYDEFHANRRKFMRVIGVSASLAALGGVAGCDQAEKGGTTPVPTQTVPAVMGEMPVALPGEPMPPAPSPQVAGGIPVVSLFVFLFSKRLDALVFTKRSGVKIQCSEVLCVFFIF